MRMSENDLSKYAPVNDRLKEIIDQVSDESIGLDAALDLFEEAVQLGVRASTLLEEDIVSHDAPAHDADTGNAGEPSPQAAGSGE
jgi:exodeoxyribonuclease VII small subunit